MHICRRFLQQTVFAHGPSYFKCKGTCNLESSRIRDLPVRLITLISHVESQVCRGMSTLQRDTVMNVFDRKAKMMQKERAALGRDGEDVTVYDYIKDEFGLRIADRICDIKRKFGIVVDLGCGRGHLTKNLYSDMVDTVYQCDISSVMLKQAAPSPEATTYKLIVDEEFLPFKDNSIDMMASNLSLHWVNDLPGCLRQIIQALKNDGVLLGSMFGGDTLFEMRVSLQLAELEREGGFAAHVSPFTTVNDLGNLLTRAGFTMLTLDLDEVIITYPSLYELMYDLKGMAENNCAWSRRPQLHRDALLAAAAIYKEMFGNDKGIPATFQVINFIGWKPDPSQPKAAERGSGQVSLKDIDQVGHLAKQIQELRTEEEKETQTESLLEEAEKIKKDLQKSRDGPESSGDDKKGR